MDRTQLLQRFDEAWRGLLASYADLSESEMIEPGVSGSWSVKDVIAHVTSWEDEALTHLPVILAGGRPPRYSVTYGGIDAFNAKTMERVRRSALVRRAAPAGRHALSARGAHRRSP